MADHNPAGAAKEAAAVQAVELAFSLVLLAATVLAHLALREVSGPDFTTTLAMRLAKQSERGWAGAAGWCWRRAERFRRDYEGATNAH